MRIIRSYIPEAMQIGQEFILSEAASNHLVRVLRLGVNDACGGFLVGVELRRFRALEGLVGHRGREGEGRPQEGLFGQSFGLITGVHLNLIRRVAKGVGRDHRLLPFPATIEQLRGILADSPTDLGGAKILLCLLNSLSNLLGEKLHIVLKLPQGDLVVIIKFRYFRHSVSRVGIKLVLELVC